MNPWSSSTNDMPTYRSGPRWVTKSSVSGAANSRNVPACAIAFARRDGRRSSGYDTKSRRRSPALFSSGLLAVMIGTTYPNATVSFETPAQNQMASCTHLQAAIQFPASRKQTIIAKWCSKRPARAIVPSPRAQSGSRATIGTRWLAAIAGWTSARSSETTSAA